MPRKNDNQILRSLWQNYWDLYGDKITADKAFSTADDGKALSRLVDHVKHAFFEGCEFALSEVEAHLEESMEKAFDRLGRGPR